MKSRRSVISSGDDAPTDIARTVGMVHQPSGGTDPVELANQLRPILLHINRHLRREVHALGVTAGQTSLLATIRDQPGLGVGELAAREGTSAPSVSTQIDRLQSAGLVSRVRATGSDRRRVGLRLTAEGLRVLRAVRSRRTAWLATRLERLSADDRHAIASALEALASLPTRA